ncbi:MAG: OPT/YSL family transporter, partial [Vicinamibacteria bacterium]
LYDYYSGQWAEAFGPAVVMIIAGDMLQDLKVGHLLGGTPKAMEKAELIGVVAAALLMTFPMMILHKADIMRGGNRWRRATSPAGRSYGVALAGDRGRRKYL